MKTKLLTTTLTILILSFFQSATLDLRLSRDWGYGGLDNKIQGRFSMHASGPEDLVEVRFRMDGVIVNVDTEAPFRFQFETDNFDSGLHEISAAGLLSNGETIESEVLIRNFLSSDEANAETRGLVVPILVVVGAITLLGVGVPLLFGRNKKHTPGSYGAAGGAVCVRCAMPFSRSVLAPNMIVGKLERCPHCGKWAIVPRANTAALEAAEARLAAEISPDVEVFESMEEKQARLLDESRFDN